MPVISTNTAANSAVRYLNINAAQESSSLAKLSSGSKITQASDDAAGLGQRAAGAAENATVLDDAGKRRREVVAADRQVVRGQKNEAVALDRAGRGAAGREP